MIAQELAIRHSDRVGALVLAATYAKPDDNVRAHGADDAASIPKSIEPKQLFKMMMGLVLTPEFIARERDWLRALARAHAAPTSASKASWRRWRR